MNNNIAPTAAQDRIVWLDILRGFALLGILLINIVGFAWPMLYAEMLDKNLAAGPVDRWLEVAISWLVQGKFYTLFSLLFGIGFMIFINHAVQKGSAPRKLFIRRVLMLLGIGILHTFLLWWGDILLTYALCALLLVFFYNCKPRTLLIWIGTLFFCLLMMLLTLYGFIALMGLLLGDEFKSEFAGLALEYQALYDQSLANYGAGGWSEIMAQRATDWSQMLSTLVMSPFIILPIFLLGAYIAQSGLLQRLQTNRRLLMKAMGYSLLIGVVFTGLKEFCDSRSNLLLPSLYDAGLAIFGFIGDLGLAGFYATGILWLLQIKVWQRLLMTLRWAGRMALTNYLAQSIICGLLFYNVGFGLYGELSLTSLAILAAAIFGIQVVYSWLWFKRFSYGPVEWLWRRWTYGKLFVANAPESDRAQS